MLMAAATVATAYSAYEATRWGGVQATDFTQAGATRTESAKALSEGFSLVGIDTALFTEFAVAFTQDNDRLERFLVERFFRSEFLPAFNAWVKQRPLKNPDAPKNPFATREYKVKKLQESTRLEKEATALFEDGREANQTSDNYVLGTIFFAAVLFFGGLSTKFGSNRVAMIAVGFGTVVFLAGVVRVITLPFH